MAAAADHTGESSRVVPETISNGHGPAENGSAAAGPSTPRKANAKVSNFLSDDEDDVDDDDLARSSVSNPVSNRRDRVLANGKSDLLKGKKRKAGAGMNGHGHGAKRVLSSDEELRREAERLFVARQELPFYQGRKMILEEILSHETTVIIGETGCGKSTQLPQLLRRHALSLSHYSHAGAPRIAVTQPRRLPAIALAQRVSAEMGTRLGDEVGFTVRFEDATSHRTGVRYLTEGVLMRELASSSRGGESEEGLDLLLRYDIVVIDEAHERTLNTDFLCGALKKIQRIRQRLASASESEGGGKGEGTIGHMANGGSVGARSGAKGKGKPVRPLKIVVMSATLDPSKFTRFFETGRDALIVKGRMFPVGTCHALEPVDDYIESAARQAIQIHCTSGQDGDVLVFMPGSDEIENCVEVLRRAAKDLPEDHRQLLVLPLYASLPPAAQAKIFATAPKNTRRVIVATNIAETSLTIPGVVSVIDTGYKKEKEYIFRTSGAIEHLRKKNISKAAAWQRTGRAGREREGQCFRLYTQEAFAKLAEFDAPEIQRCNLAAAVLQLVAMGQDPFTFEFIDHPGRDPILAAFQTLAGLGALKGPTEITPLGSSMLAYPLDPVHARILLASFDAACPSEIIDILSLVVAGPVWIDRANDRDNIALARAKFIHRDGDHLTGMNVLRAYMAIRESKDVGVAKWCKDNFVNSKTLAHAVRIRDQLRELAVRQGRDPDSSCGTEWDRVGKCLLAGLFMNSAIITPDGTYRQTAGSLQVKIHPSSVLMSKKTPAILYDELTITSSIYARNVSAFEQQWLTEIPWFQQAGQGSATVANGTI